MSYCVACEARSTHRDHDVGVVVRVVTLLGFRSTTQFQFHLNITEGSSIIKYRSSSKRGVIRKMLNELWSFFDLDFG